LKLTAIVLVRPLEQWHNSAPVNSSGGLSRAMRDH
jgi:hypothetical protein